MQVLAAKAALLRFPRTVSYLIGVQRIKSLEDDDWRINSRDNDGDITAYLDLVRP